VIGALMARSCFAWRLHNTPNRGGQDRRSMLFRWQIPNVDAKLLEDIT